MAAAWGFLSVAPLKKGALRQPPVLRLQPHILMCTVQVQLRAPPSKLSIALNSGGILEGSWFWGEPALQNVSPIEVPLLPLSL